MLSHCLCCFGLESAPKLKKTKTVVVHTTVAQLFDVFWMPPLNLKILHRSCLVFFFNCEGHKIDDLFQNFLLEIYFVNSYKRIMLGVLSDDKK